MAAVVALCPQLIGDIGRLVGLLIVGEEREMYHRAVIDQPRAGDVIARQPGVRAEAGRGV